MYVFGLSKPHWGDRKIRERLLRRFSCEVKVPARSTIHAVLDRHRLVRRRGPKRNHAQGTPLSLGQQPNELWCTDYKGEFLLGNKKYCYPLTVTDHAGKLSAFAARRGCRQSGNYSISINIRAFHRTNVESGKHWSLSALA